MKCCMILYREGNVMLTSEDVYCPLSSLIGAIKVSSNEILAFTECSESELFTADTSKRHFNSERSVIAGHTL